MKISHVTIRISQSGFVVALNRNLDDLKVFRSDEPERFVKFIAEEVAGVKIDRIVDTRLEERARVREKMDRTGSVTEG